VITPELLRDVFEIEGTVLRDVHTGAPVIIPERSVRPETITINALGQAVG
jgi:iron complex transport system ATP-binding protein